MSNIYICQNDFDRRAALEREIETKVNSLDDIVKTTPLVLKFVVSYNRLEPSLIIIKKKKESYGLLEIPMNS